MISQELASLSDVHSGKRIDNGLVSSGRSSGGSNSVNPLPGQYEPNLENFFPPSSTEEESCSVAMNNQIEVEVCESSDTDTSIESDPFECSEEAEDVTMNQDSQPVDIECDEASRVQWMIDEEYEDLGISEMGTIGEYGLELNDSMTALFDVPVIEVDGALGAENEYGAEMGVNEEMGDDEAAENKAIILEYELEHAIDQLIAECSQDLPMEPEPIGEGNGDDDGSDSSSYSFDSLTPEPADPSVVNITSNSSQSVVIEMMSNLGLSPRTVQPENVLWALPLTQNEVIHEVTVNTMENQLVVQQDPQEGAGNSEKIGWRKKDFSGMCPYAQLVEPYMVEYGKCYCCGGVGYVSMYCPYIAPRVDKGSSRGVGPSTTVAAKKKCLNEGMTSFLWVRCECPECMET
ncbi:unnamed protein product [Arabidopsis halleri]